MSRKFLKSALAFWRYLEGTFANPYFMIINEHGILVRSKSGMFSESFFWIMRRAFLQVDHFTFYVSFDSHGLYALLYESDLR